MQYYVVDIVRMNFCSGQLKETCVTKGYNPFMLSSLFLCRVKYYSISVSVHLLQSVLHVVQVGYAYLLMLVAMTYNGWLFLSIAFGAGVGYLLFAKSRHLMGNFREQNEHCHH